MYVESNNHYAFDSCSYNICDCYNDIYLLKEVSNDGEWRVAA